MSQNLNASPDLSHLTGIEIEGVARSLVVGPIETLLNRREEIVKMNTDDLRRISDLAAAARSNCGGFGCG